MVRATVIRRLWAAHGDPGMLLDQPFIGLTQAVAALPGRHHVLVLPVQNINELDVSGVHGFTLFRLQHDFRVRMSGGKGIHPG